MMIRRLGGWTLAVVLIGAVGAPAAWAMDDSPPAAEDPTPAATPVQRGVWLVTGHAVGDTASHAIDVVVRPAYRGASQAWWWLEERVYRAQPPTVHVDMPRPESLAPTTPAASLE